MERNGTTLPVCRRYSDSASKKPRKDSTNGVKSGDPGDHDTGPTRQPICLKNAYLGFWLQDQETKTYNDAQGSL
jgi:hypothetical protein